MSVHRAADSKSIKAWLPLWALQLFAMVFGLSSVHGIQRDLLFAPSVSEAPCLSHRNLRAAKPTVTLCLCAPDC